MSSETNGTTQGVNSVAVSSSDEADRMRALESEVAQLRERNERYSSIAHNANHGLEGLQKKYRVLEADRNGLLQQLRERDHEVAERDRRIAALEADLRRTKKGKA